MKPLILIGSVLLLLILGAFEINACTCGPAPSVCGQLEQIKNSKNGELVFVGVPKSVKKVKITYEEDGETDILHLNKYTFQIDEVFAGKIKEKDFIFTPSTGAICGYNFEIGEKYLVYATSTPLEIFGTSLCSGNKKIEEASKDIDVLRELKQTGKVKPKIFGKVNFVQDKNKDLDTKNKKLFKIYAKENETGNIIEKFVESGNFFNFSDLSFGEYWFTIIVDGIEANISKPIILSEENVCQEVNISTSQNELEIL